ncbi:MAG: DUF2817 domain-containing protein [Pseudomonadota bacterium]
MTNRKPGPADVQYFAPTYDIGRAWFKMAVETAGGAFQSYLKPDQTGPVGEPLSIDVGWVGARTAPNVFLSLSGTHGQEYFCGAAGQLQWLNGHDPAHLPMEMAVCLIHAVNPFGAAYCTRTNEDLVDLNRNFRDRFNTGVRDEVYRAVFDLLAKAELDDFVLSQLFDEFNALIARYGAGLVMTAIAGGQSMDPEGPAFCGTQPAWERQILFEIIRSWLPNAKRVALIDWHTGLGPSGEPSALFTYSVGTEHYNRACDWWGEPPSADALYQAESQPRIEGEVRQGLADELTGLGAECIHTVVEIGTVDTRAIIPAFAIDRWLRLECRDPKAPEAVRLRTMMMERYSPSLPEWREKALKSMAGSYTSTLRGLSEWHADTEGG